MFDGRSWRGLIFTICLSTYLGVIAHKITIIVLQSLCFVNNTHGKNGTISLMKVNTAKFLQRVTARHRYIGVLVIGSVLLVILILFIPPHRSVAAYCKVYNEAEVKLANAQGSTYSVAIFKHRSSNAHDFALALGKLDRVAPSDIEPDIKTLKNVFESIDSDSAQTLGASLSGLGAESRVKEWTTTNCNN